MLAKIASLLLEPPPTSSTTTTSSSSSSGPKEEDEHLEEAISQVRIFVERGLAKTSRSPEDFVPYQRFLWKYSQRHIGSDSRVQEGKPATARAELMELVQEMKYRFHLRLWHNTFNDISLLSPPTPPPRRGGLVEQTMVEVGKDSMGPPRLFQSIQSAFVLHLFADWRSSPLFTLPSQTETCAHSSPHLRKTMSVDQHPQRVKQLHALLSLFRQSRSFDLESSDRATLFCTFVSVLFPLLVVLSFPSLLHASNSVAAPRLLP